VSDDDDDYSNGGPFGSPQLRALQWTPPKPKPVTEQARAATEQHFRDLNVLGQMIGASFDVTEALHERGLLSSEEVAQKQAAEAAAQEAAEAKAKQVAEWTANDRTERAAQLEADAERAGAELAEGLARKLGKSVKKALKATMKGR
jgi:hypothetical protein